MFKVTRFRQALLFLGLAAVNEEAAVINTDDNLDDMPRHGAEHFHVAALPSTVGLKEMMAKHHLSLPKDMAQELGMSMSAANKTDMPQATPGMKAIAQTKAALPSHKHS